MTKKDEILGECSHHFISKIVGNFPGHEHIHLVDEQFCMECKKTIKEIVSEAITRVVESVPCDEKSLTIQVDNASNTFSNPTPYQDGYNQHVQEIKHWKQQWLGEGAK